MTLLVSTYVVCERLSVMHEPAGVVEILVQILQNTPILKYSFRIPPPPKIEIKADLGTLRLFSFRTMCGKLPHVETLSSPGNYSLISLASIIFSVSVTKHVAG